MSKINFIGMSIKKHIRDFGIFEFVDNGVSVVVGLLIMCKNTGRVFLVQRNDANQNWSLLSGGYDPNVDVDYLDCLKREMKEELFRDMSKINIEIKNGGDEFIKSKNRNFKYFYGFVDNEFDVILDDENLKWGWFKPNGRSTINGSQPTFGLPDNLYPGLKQKIDTIFKID
jgi:8-oxo-dGTP pyrophosphatase MutT (NUDIX family)